MNALKIVGRRKTLETPEQFHEAGSRLDREIDLLCPTPRPRGFVFKAKTWEESDRWRASQTNPRLW